MIPLKIGIVGAGFSGTALTAMLPQLSHRPVEVFLFESTGRFGPGIAYATTSPFHLLNVPSDDMSAFETERTHFADWLKQAEKSGRYPGEWRMASAPFASRFLYGEYLKDILAEVGAKTALRLQLIPEKVVSVSAQMDRPVMFTATRHFEVDKVILSMGNSLPPLPAFPVENTNCFIGNPWNHEAFRQIPKEDSVVLLGSGLTMVDAVLSLYHQQHRGRILSLSRRGLLPQPHRAGVAPYVFTGKWPKNLAGLLKCLRQESKILMHQGGDWRSIVTAFRPHIPSLWSELALPEKKRFLRHAQTVWNVHRHRVPEEVLALLRQLEATQQLEIFGGRIRAFHPPAITLKRRGASLSSEEKADWVINCMGPSPGLRQDPLIQSLVEQGLARFDACSLGVDVSSLGALINAEGQTSTCLYALGSPCKGVVWECTAVPEIRRQSFTLARHLLG